MTFPRTSRNYLKMTIRRILPSQLFVVLTLCAMLAVGATQTHAQTVGCLIASNDGPNGFRTDEISGCRINTSNGNATFVRKQRQRSRTYNGMQPLTQQHLDIAKYWLNRTGQLRFQSRYNRAGFDIAAFLEAASRATSGFVLIRTKRNGSQAINIVYITNGVYRSIDFESTNVRDLPSGFLTTGL